jgi:hypothetical protein
MIKQHNQFVFDITQIHTCYNRILINNQRLFDDDILIILQSFIKLHNNIRIGLIDSQLSALIMNNYLNDKETNKKTLDYFLKYFSYKYDIVTIPLFYRSHWSLVLYIRLYDYLLYLDSNNNYHKFYFNNLCEMLYKQNININYKIHIDSVIQEGDWECGYYIIMFFHLCLRIYTQKQYFGKEQFIGFIESSLSRKFNINNFKTVLNQIIYIQIKREEYNIIK